MAYQGKEMGLGRSKTRLREIIFLDVIAFNSMLVSFNFPSMLMI